VQCKYHHLKTQVRVAGGWVRDKLLGKQSIDIDLALDDIMGAVFAAKVNEYLQSLGDEVHDIGVIKLNPGQSKHLETATFKVNGVLIDATNLRTETYDTLSRIPQMVCRPLPRAFPLLAVFLFPSPTPPPTPPERCVTHCLFRTATWNGEG
jgi:tRNA nucleotidyltransferase/poly(A) polymerase